MSMDEDDADPHTYSVVCSEDQGVEFDYHCCVVPDQVGGLCEIVPVCYIDTKLLVAVPYSAWSRTVAKRALGEKALSKFVLVEVGQCAPYQREVPEAEEVMKVWMGFLHPGLLNLVHEPAEDEIPVSVFADGEYVGFLPFAGALEAAARDHFAFLTATEGADTPTPGPARRRAPLHPEVPAGSGLGSDGQEDRLTKLETMMERLVLRMEGKPFASDSSGQARPSALRPPKDARRKLDKTAELYPDLDPSVVAAAISAGVERSALQEMQKLMQVGKKKQEKFQDPVPPRVHFGADGGDVLSESETEPEVGGNAEGSGGARQSGSTSPVAEAVAKLTQLVAALAEDKSKKKGSKVEAALDGVSSSGITDSGSLGSGKRTAAARRALRTALQESPEDIYQLLEKAMIEDLTSQTLTPGQPQPTLCSRAWVEHRSRIGHWKTPAYCAWSVSGALDRLIQGDTAGCRARLGLLLLMLDQTACDRGNWTLSSELSLESGPPMAALQQHTPPSVADGEQPFSKLLDARWAEVAMSHVRETEEFVTKRLKLGRKDAADTAEPKAKAKGKSKAGDKTGQQSGEV